MNPVHLPAEIISLIINRMESNVLANMLAADTRAQTEANKTENISISEVPIEASQFYVTLFEALFNRNTGSARLAQRDCLSRKAMLLTANKLEWRETLLNNMQAKPFDFAYNLQAAIFIHKKNENKSVYQIIKRLLKANISEQQDIIPYLSIVMPKDSPETLAEYFDLLIKSFSSGNIEYVEFATQALIELSPQFNQDQISRVYEIIYEFLNANDSFMKAVSRCLLRGMVKFFNEQQIYKVVDLCLGQLESPIVEVQVRALNTAACMASHWTSLMLDSLFSPVHQYISHPDMSVREGAISIAGVYASRWDSEQLEALQQALLDNSLNDSSPVNRENAVLFFKSLAKYQNSQQLNTLFDLLKEKINAQHVDPNERGLPINALAALALNCGKDLRKNIHVFLLEKSSSEHAHISLQAMKGIVALIPSSCVSEHQDTVKRVKSIVEGNEITLKRQALRAIALFANKKDFNPEESFITFIHQKTSINEESSCFEESWNTLISLSEKLNNAERDTMYATLLDFFPTPMPARMSTEARFNRRTALVMMGKFALKTKNENQIKGIYEKLITQLNGNYQEGAIAALEIMLPCIAPEQCVALFKVLSKYNTPNTISLLFTLARYADAQSINCLRAHVVHYPQFNHVADLIQLTSHVENDAVIEHQHKKIKLSS